MCQTYVRLPRLFTSLAVAGMLGFGAHAAVGSPAAASCPLSGGGMHPSSCSVGPAGNAYCDGVCKGIYGTDSAGECFQEGCCLCTV